MRKLQKLVREGRLVAEIEVTLVEDPDGWAPYLSVADARRLDEARKALQRGDVRAASQIGHVYELSPVTA
jgi:hypothetical protein